MRVNLIMRDGSTRQDVELIRADVFPFDVVSYRTRGHDVCSYSVCGQSIGRVEILGGV